jgi:hypothetical protein
MQCLKRSRNIRSQQLVSCLNGGDVMRRWRNRPKTRRHTHTRTRNKNEKYKTGLLDLSGSGSVALNCVMCSSLSLFLPSLETQNERKMRERGRERDNGGWLVAPVMKQRFYTAISPTSLSTIVSLNAPSVSTLSALDILICFLI